MHFFNLKYLYLIVAVLIIALSGGYIYYLSIKGDSLQTQIDSLKIAILQHLNSYVLVIDGSRSLVATSSDISLAYWQKYFTEIALAENYKGISSVGYSESVKRENVPTFEKELQSIYNDNSIKVHPASDAATPLILKFVYPFSEDRQKAVGLDITTRPEQFATISQSIMSGLPTVSPKSPFATTGNVGFSIVEPIFVKGARVTSEEERKSAFRGVIGAALYTEDFFKEIFKNGSPEKIRVRIYDGSVLDEVNLFYDTDPDLGAFRVAGEEEINFLNATWTLAYQSK